MSKPPVTGVLGAVSVRKHLPPSKLSQAEWVATIAPKLKIAAKDVTDYLSAGVGEGVERNFVHFFTDGFATKELPIATKHLTSEDGCCVLSYVYDSLLPCGSAAGKLEEALDFAQKTFIRFIIPRLLCYIPPKAGRASMDKLLEQAILDLEKLPGYTTKIKTNLIATVTKKGNRSEIQKTRK